MSRLRIQYLTISATLRAASLRMIEARCVSAVFTLMSSTEAASFVE